MSNTLVNQTKSLLMFGILFFSFFSAEKTSAEQLKPSFLGFTIGILGGITSHETGHVIAGLSLGMSHPQFLINDKESGAGIGVRMDSSEIKPEDKKRATLIMKASGSLGQIVPVLILPPLAQRIKNADIKYALQIWTAYGVMDFPLYVMRDILMYTLGVFEKDKVRGDWLEFSELSGIPLYALFGASLVWSALLYRFVTVQNQTNYQKTGVEFVIPLFTICTML